MKKVSPLKDILKPKDLINPYIAAGMLGAIAARSEIDSLTNKTIDRAVHKLVLPRVKDRSPDYPTGRLWHGTGRYRYHNGEIVDVLKNIAESGYILPNYDKFDVSRPMISISLARSRLYARSYADMHGAGAHEKDRYGSSLFWACSFLGSVAIEASKEMQVYKPSGYYKMLGHLANANAVEWYKKITRVQNASVVTVYKKGSDIYNNYPVLFNIKNAETIETSKAVALHEERTEKPLDLYKDVHHIEVPQDRVEETQAIVGDVMVLPIEMGEYYSSRYSFSQHMHEII